MAEKWNWHKHEYEPYELPEGSTIYSHDMDAKVACAQCGKEIVFGQAYTSLEIHNNIGFGYAVCSNCYKQEWKRRTDEVDRECDEEWD